MAPFLSLALTVDKIKSRIHADDATDVETSDVKKKKAASSKFKFLSSKKVDDSGQEQLLVLTGYLFITRAWLKDQINDKDVPVRHVFFLVMSRNSFVRSSSLMLLLLS